MTDKIKLDLQRRNALFVKARNSDDPESWKEYNVLKNQINKDIQNAKANCGNSFKRVNDNFQKSYMKRNVYKQKEKDLSFSCDMCDRGFPTDSEYKEHCALHVKCHYTGCNFEAHPKVLALHQKMQHDTGYADEINKLQNDEEIKKWREERRKRFPTAENILKRKAEQAEKEERGEVIETKDFGQFNKRKFDKNKSHQNQPRRRQRNRTRQPRNFQSRWFEKSSDSEEDDYHIKLPRFKGTNKNYELHEDEKDPQEDLAASEIPSLKESMNDDVDEHHNKQYSGDKAPPEISVPTETIDQQVASDQLDSKNSDDEAPCEIPVSREPLNQPKTGDQKDSDDEAPCEIPISREPIEQPKTDDQEDHSNKNGQSDLIPASAAGSSNSINNAENKRKTDVTSAENEDKNNNKRKRNNREPARPNRSISFLEMLLDDEIRHERNVVLQSIRYIVRNNFFGIGAGKKNDLE